MFLPPGTRLGPYDVLAPIGAGGMGEVYRARDTRLGREVAIKVLPPDVASDADRLGRFEREARAAAALNHPNILAVFDIGSSAQSAYIVTELLEGQTLRDMLMGERLAVPRAVDLAAQIADGLAAAHGRGIVHRDIKPENIFVTADGRAKILDFGLAKLVTTDDPGGPEAPTRSATSPHTVLGTAGYMAPEQVRGQPVDHRADIFAFGAVLYEMLSGRRAFSGENALDVMSAILREPPAPLSSSVDRPVPPALQRLVDRCLEKSPAARFQSTTDLAFTLKTISQGDSTVAPAASAPPQTMSAGHRRKRIAWGFSAIASLGLITTMMAWWWRPTPVPPPAIFFAVPPPETGSIGVGGGVAMAISPDGTQIVFGANTGNAASRPSLWVRSLGSIDARSLPAAANISVNASPFWSPNSRAVGFWSEGKLRRIDLDSGVVTVIGDTPPVSGPTWGPDGTIIFGSQFGAAGGGGLYRISAGGGAPVPLTTPDAQRGEQQHSRPYFLPDGRHFVFLAVPRRICVGSLDSPEVKDILAADSQAVYSLGYLLYVRQATLLAQRFDSGRLETVGEPMVVAEDVRTSPRTAVAQFAASANGVLVYQTGDVSRSAPLAWLDRTGRVISTIPDSTADYIHISLSADAHQAVAGLRAGTGGVDLWAVDLDRGTRLRLTPGASRILKPLVSPEGTRVVWTAGRPRTMDLFWKRSDGVGPDEPVFKSSSPVARIATDWSNQSIVFVTGQGPSQIWVAPVPDPAQAKLYLEAKYALRDARLSPDGHWMAYASNDSNLDQIFQIFVQPFPVANGGRWLVSGADGGTLPHWRADAQEIIYLAPGRRIMAVSMKFGPRGVEPSTPQLLFPAPGEVGDLTRDHTRFLTTLASASPAQRSPLTVVVNWPSVLPRH
jgi:serine/threonine protein kinase